jgi:hypothetical protein
MFNRIWHSKSAESFYQQIKNAGFDSRIYIDGTSHGTPDIYADRFSNVMETDISYNVEKKELLKKIINVSLFSAVPYICKRFFMYDAASINEHVTSSIHSNPRIALPHNNASFYKKMIASGITIDGDSPVLAFYYTSGAHAPFRINEKCEMVATPFKDPLPTIKSCLFIVSEFIRMLKENNIYDNTAIFICSDHGSHGLSRNTPYDMSFILKPFNQNNSSIIIDESKVQSIDIIPLLLQLACGSKSDCSSFEGFPPSQVPADRERIVRLLTVHPDIPAFMEDYSGKTKFQYNAEKVFLFSDADSFMKRDFSPRVQADGANSAFLRYVPLNSEAVVDETILLEPLPWNDSVGRRTIWTRRLKRLFK